MSSSYFPKGVSMAARISESKFLSSTVAQQAAVKGIDDALPTGGGPLPGGIRGGVAKLTAIWFEEDAVNGEGFRAEAEVILPEVFSGQYIKGKKTKQWVTFNAENLEDRIPRIRDILKGLAGRAAMGDGKSIDFIKLVEFIDKATKRSPIHFGFSTSPKDNSDWPWENWHQAIPGFVAPNAPPVSTTDQKKTNDVATTNGDGKVNSSNPEPWSSRQSTPLNTVVESASYNPHATEGVYTDTDDLTTVISRAVVKDQSAIDKLCEFAKALGYTDDDLDESESWEQVGGWVKSGKVRGDNGDDKGGTPKREFTMNQVYTYEPSNKKDATKRLKSRECRVTNVDNIRNVVTLQNLANKLEVFEVSFDDEFLK